jgi:hypothetical protein
VKMGGSRCLYLGLPSCLYSANRQSDYNRVYNKV